MSDEIKTEAELQERIRNLVDWIESSMTPDNIPLLPEQQAAFIRVSLRKSKTISESEPFRRAAVLAAAQSLNEFNRKSAKK